LALQTALLSRELQVHLRPLNLSSI
jgi:hypothetical protein